MVENGNTDHDGEFRKPKKPTVEELPEIAENIDAIDYYNAVGLDHLAFPFINTAPFNIRKNK